MTQQFLFSRATMLVVSLISAVVVTFFVWLDTQIPSILLGAFVATFLFFAAVTQFIRYNFRLGLRSLLVLMTLTCLLLGIVGRRAVVARRQYNAVWSIMGFSKPWPVPNVGETTVRYRRQPPGLTKDETRIYNGMIVPKWLEELAPKDFLYDVETAQFLSQDLSHRDSLSDIDLGFFDELVFSQCKMGDSMEVVAELKRVKSLAFWKSIITDADASFLSKVKQLESLTIERWSMTPALTDQAIPELVKLKKLEHLSLAGSELTGDGLKRLAELPNLRMLNVSRTKLTNDDVKHLLDFPSLVVVNLLNTAVDEQSIETLLKLKGEASVTLTASSETNKQAAEKLLANQPVDTKSNVWIQLESP